MYERMYQKQRLREQFINKGTDDSSKQIRKEEAEAYKHEVERFQELLLILIHMCGGQPRRAPEILSIR